MTTVTIRKATERDIPELARQRRMMFEAMGFDNSQRLILTEQESIKFFLEGISGNKFHGWVAVTKAGKIVCNAGIIIDQHPPGPINLSGKIAYIFNLFTLPEFRRQGIAKRIMQAILNWVKEFGIDIVTLHTTEEGAELYKNLGFILSQEMYLNTGK